MTTGQALIAERILNSLKGISGTGGLFGAVAQSIKKLMLEPGDLSISGQSPIRSAIPVAADLWYLFNAVNLVYEADPEADPEEYVEENLKFLEDKLGGLMPMSAVTAENLINYAEDTGELNPRYGQPGESFRRLKDNWENEGEYFIQVLAYELSQEGIAFEYNSKLPGEEGEYEQEDYCGGLMFPVGQLGVMEVVSLFQETELEADDFELKDDERPIVVDDPDMFPPTEGYENNKCFGKHLVEDGYLVPKEFKSQVELMSTVSISDADYSGEIKPKTWTKWWIKKTDKLPVPGEFIGILIKPLPVPPHVWWFQETSPLLYAGNWVETQNLTSGVITKVTLEDDRTDGGVGEEYQVKVNGVEFIAYASDFKLYEVDDRVAVLKVKTTEQKTANPYTWKNHRDGTHPVKDEVSSEFMIMPITFYKES